MTDYLGSLRETDRDILHFGVKGMKWGVRKSDKPSKELKMLGPSTITRKTSRGETLTLSHRPPNALHKSLAAISSKYREAYSNGANLNITNSSGKKVGDAMVQKKENGELYLLWLGIDKSARGQGYATAAMEVARDYGKKSGFKKLTLEVPGNSPDARHIYEKLGFKVTKEGDPNADDGWGGLTEMEYNFGQAKHDSLNLDEDYGWFMEGMLKKMENDLGHGEEVTMTDHISAFKASDSDILHFGVKGMKWGVRKDGARGKLKRGLSKASAALDAGEKVINEGEKKLIFLPMKNRKQAASNTQLRVLNAARKINKQSEFKGKDLKKNPELKKKYMDQVSVKAKKIYAEELDNSRADAWEETLNVAFNRDDIVLRGMRSRIQHSDDDAYETLLTLKVTYDDLGQIEDLTVPDSLEHTDLKHYGVKGMKWGQRKAEKPSLDTPSGPESSSDKYTRLMAKSKRDGANTLSDEELRFVTQRGNAIAQVNRLNEKKPGWIQDLARQVIKQQTQKQLQNVSKDLESKIRSS